MAWTLGNLTLKDPAAYMPDELENSVSHVTLGNRTVKQVRGRKQLHKLAIKALTPQQFEDIKNLVDANEAVTFSVTDGQLSISARQVFAEITSRSYAYKGASFLQDVVLELKEVD